MKCNMCREDFPKGLVYPELYSMGGLGKKGTWVCWGCLANILDECKGGAKGVKIKSGFTRELEIVDIK